MDRPYVGQDLRLVLTGDVNIAGGSAKMRYVKPDTTAYVEVTATIQWAPDGTCYYDFTPAVMTIAGLWKAWLKLTDASAKTYIGELYTFMVYDEGT